jgi:hypothetical protein
MVFACGLTARANIMSASASSSSPGLTVVSSTADYGLPGSQNLGLTVSGTQSNPALPAGVLTANVVTSSGADPTIGIINSLMNETSGTWSSYGLQVSMPQTFTITPLPGFLSPSDWTETPSGPNGTGPYVANILYQVGSGNDPILPGQTLQFGYQLTFSGATDYTVTETINPVPEPATLGLCAAAFAMAIPFVVRKRRKRLAATQSDS